MKIEKLLRLISLVVLIASVILTTGTALAQDLLNTITLTEANLNAALAEADVDGQLTLDLQPGQMVLNYTGTDPRGNALTMRLTLIPYVEGGQLRFDTATFSINGFTLSLDNLRNNAAVGDTMDTVSGLFGETASTGYIESVVVTDTSLTLATRPANPDDPTLTIVDNLWSLTFTEEAINGYDWMISPADPTISTMRVDLQNGQALLRVVGVNGGEIDFTIIPTVVNDFINWKVYATAGEESNAGVQALSLWRAYTDAIYTDTLLVNAVITDNDLTLTWDVSLESGSVGAPQEVIYTSEESEVNTLIAQYMPDGETFLVDMQPGQVVLNAAGTDPSGVLYTVTLTLVPEINSGALLWLPTELTVNGLTVTLEDLQNNDTLIANWTQAFNQNNPNAQVLSIEITDTTMSLIVRY